MTDHSGAGGTPGAARHKRAKVISLSHRRHRRDARERRLLRLAPEYDGLCLLYRHRPVKGNQVYAMQLLCWGLRANGEVVGLVPWLDRLAASSELNDLEGGSFEGFFDPQAGQVFADPPAHKAAELEGALRFFGTADSDDPLQEIPDTIGTHALFASEDNRLILAEVLSWRLQPSGRVEAMLIDENAVHKTPVLPGDDCLYAAQDHPQFCYFFQHHIANQIKAEDPEALAAVALLFEP